MDARHRRKLSVRSEEERFEFVYRENYGRVLAYALRRSTPELAHDVVADTFLVAWRRLDRLPEEPLPWLLAVARKTLANHRRAGHRREALLLRLEAVDAKSTTTAVESVTLTMAEIVDAVERLPESDQELLELIAWDDLTIGEAAAVVGVSAATCRVRLYRARRRLARELARGAEPARRTRRGRFLELGKEQ
jgi:RNA polymerase sigma factor (sigma-70 family)